MLYDCVLRLTNKLLQAIPAASKGVQLRTQEQECSSCVDCFNKMPALLLALGLCGKDR